MAKNKAADKSTSFNPTEIESDIPEGFVVLGSDRLMYKPELCGSVDLRGVLMDATLHKAKKPGDDDFHILHFFTTAPTLGVDNDEVIEVPAGKDIMIVATDKLKDLVQFASHEINVPEVIIKVLGTTRTSGGFDMWMYRRLISRTPWTRTQVAELRLKNATSGSAMDQLTAGGVNNVPMRKPEHANVGG